LLECITGKGRLNVIKDSRKTVKILQQFSAKLTSRIQGNKALQDSLLSIPSLPKTTSNHKFYTGK
jgi:hypothetical protein